MNTEIAKKLIKIVFLGLLAKGTLEVGNKMIENIADGKDALGREKKPKKFTRKDWRGNIQLGTDDYLIE